MSNFDKQERVYLNRSCFLCLRTDRIFATPAEDRVFALYGDFSLKRSFRRSVTLVTGWSDRNDPRRAAHQQPRRDCL